MLTIVDVLMLVSAIAPLILFFIMRYRVIKKSDELKKPKDFKKNLKEKEGDAKK